MKKFIALLSLLTFSHFAFSDDIDSAYSLCSALENTGAITDCDVSGWGKSVNVRLDMSGSEARKLCGPVANMVSGKFNPGWKLKIFNPYSGDNAIAVCNLS